MKRDQQPDWVTRSSEAVYDNAWITVTHHEVTAPTGNDGIYGKVHFKNRAIGIVPIDADGNTWLVGQQRYTLGLWSWEIPEGGAAPGEDPLDAAKRELLEETGLVAADWAPLLELHTSNSVTDECGFAYIARQLALGDAAPDDTELLSLTQLPLQDAVNMVMNGEITDALAMAALLKVQLLLDRGELRL